VLFAVLLIIVFIYFYEPKIIAIKQNAKMLFMSTAYELVRNRLYNSSMLYALEE